MHPDHRYIHALLSGDDPLIREIYALHASTIKDWVERNNGNNADAKDLMQDALMAIVKQARQPGWHLTCPFGAYLFLICKRKWLNELEHRRLVVTNTAPAGLEDTAAIENLAEQTLMLENRFSLFQLKFESLAEGCRQLLRLSWSGHPMEEVAQKLGVTYAYARKKKSGCIAALINSIKNDPEYRNLKSK